MDKALKPCPFCGGPAVWANDEKNWVKCGECGAETSWRANTNEARAAWNRRVENDND